MSDDLEKAVLFSFDQSGGVSPDLRAQARALLQGVEASPEVWQLCLARLESSSYAEVKFWCLQTLTRVIHGPQYPSLPPEARNQIKVTLVTAGVQPPPGQLPPFLRNKVAQAVVAIAGREYPDQWPSFFQDLLGTLGQGPAAVDLFCRVLVSVDEDIVTLDVPRSAEGAKQSMHFKDSMRDRALGDIAGAWSTLVATYSQSEPGLAATVLETVQRYVHWIDIGLVANDTFVPLLFNVLNTQDEGVRGAAADVLTEIVCKRMEAIPKLTLIQSLGVVPVCAQWSSGLPGVQEEHDLAVKYAKLLATLATEVLESWKKVENSLISLAAVGLVVDDEASKEAEAACGNAANMLGALFPAVLAALRTGDDDVSSAVAPFLLSHVARLRVLEKRGGGVLPPDAAAQLLPMLEASAAAARFANDSAAYEAQAASPVERVASEEEEAAVGERRQEIFTIFKNVAKLAPPQAYTFVGSRLEAAISRPDAAWQDVELALSLLYQLGEGASEESLRSGGGALAVLAAAVMQADVPAARHRLVALALLETCARYARVLQQQQALLPRVVALFLGAQGLGHPSEVVPRRAAYLFCRLAKVLRSNLRPLLTDVLTLLQPHLAVIAASPLPDVHTRGPAAGASSGKSVLGAPAAPTGADDRLYAFEAAGMLLGLEELGEEEQLAWLSAVLQPLVAQLERNLRLATDPGGPEAAAAAAAGSPLPTALVQQSLEALLRASKGFTPRICTVTRPRVGAMLAGPLQASLAVPRQLPGNRQLRAKFVAYVHRMVEVLGPAALPHLLPTLQALMHAGADASDLADVLALLHQLMLRYKRDLTPLVQEVLPVCVRSVHALLPADWDWSGAAAAPPPAPSTAAASAPAAASQQPCASGSTEDLRERGELQRTYYSCLLSLAQSELAGTLLTALPGTMDAVLGALMRGAASHIDPGVRKICIHTIGLLAEEWLSGGPASSAATAAAGSAGGGPGGNAAGDASGAAPSPPLSPGAAAALSPGAAADAVPGFRDFVIQRFAGEVLVEGLMAGGSGVDVRDASAISLLTEVAAQLKALHQLCGNALLAHLCGVVLPRAGWPPAAQEQLASHIASSDVKQLKAFLKAVLLELRARSNGAGGR